MPGASRHAFLAGRHTGLDLEGRVARLLVMIDRAEQVAVVHDTIVRCYLADADVFGRQLLADAISRLGKTVIVGSARDARAMNREIRATSPDVVFVDARLYADSGDAPVPDADARPFQLVFVSAVAADAASAFVHGATDFLLRPYSRTRVAAALLRVRQRMEERALVLGVRTDVLARANPSLQLVDGPRDVLDVTPMLASLVIETRGGTEYVPMAMIDAISTEGHETRIYTRSSVIITRTPLLEIERRLDPAGFVRIRRGTIVSIASARRLEGVGAGCGRLLLHSSDITLFVSKRRMSAVRRALHSKP